ncbi:MULTISPECIES: hypothetical protein [Bacillus amyloliquefaciens group]|uniref:hypothetical protein n=1 Tax=Bacillus amyloliquefaciens group TaxID=1938374 RepID=UPI0005EFDEE3|nr:MULTISPECIES: hypothetical protein [Bacillus amyloliquefaciens group]QNQ51867.1 hypothetical protein IAR44_09000 [Bacillus velezensis]WJM62828.1 hypothetical protein QTN46_04010 [Bacillus amyloliquefaciens]
MGTLKNEFEKLNLFVKFTKEEYVNDILDGKLYMKNFKHFIDLEKKEKIKGQGDKFEAAFVTRAVDLRIIDLRTKKVIGVSKEAEIIERYTEASKIPLYCFTYFPSEDFKILEEKDEKIIIGLDLNPEEKDVFIKDFGEKAIIFPGDFLKKVLSSLKKQNILGVAKLVQYCDFNFLDENRRKLFENGSIDMFFWKDLFFKTQREIRIVLPEKRIEDSIIINFEGIRDQAIVLDTEDLLEGEFEIPKSILY